MSNHPPVPCPMDWGIGTVQDQIGQSWIQVVINGPTGTFVSFLEPAVAEQIAGLLVKEARQAKTGLILPPGSVNGH